MQVPAVRSATTLIAVLTIALPFVAWGQSPIVSVDSIGPSVQEAGIADPFPSPRFGRAVAISGRIAMASIPGDLAQEPNDFGRVAVFEKVEEGWRRAATFIGTEEAGDSLGRAIDIEGDTAVVAGSRALYVYERRDGQWLQTAKAVLRQTGAMFGGNVVLKRGLIAIQVTVWSDVEAPVSSVHVYDTRSSHRSGLPRGSDPAWLRPTAVIAPQDGATAESFGVDLAMDGHLLLIGAPAGDDMPGSAYVYARFGHRWMMLDRLMASDGTIGDGFGATVAMRNGIIVVGAPNADLGVGDEDGYGPPRGNVYVFLPRRGGWYQSQRLNDPADARLIRDLGYKVRIGRGLLAVRAPDMRGLIRGEDRVFVYDFIDRAFQLPQEVVSYEGFLPDIDISGRQLIVSRHDAGVFNYYVRGSAGIYAFGAAH